MGKLYPSQQSAADHLAMILTKHGAALDASDTGTGKTYVACGTAHQLGLAPLVVCPKSVIPTWGKVASEIGCDLTDVLSYEKLRTGNTPWLKRPTKAKFQWQLPAGEMVIFDEAHRCSGYKTQLSTLCALTKAYRLKTLLLSATIADSPLKMRAAGYLLGLHSFQNCYSWLLKHGCKKGFFGGIDGPPASLLPGIMADIHDEIFPERGYRMKSENMPEFPETLITAESYQIEAPATLDKICQQLAEVVADAGVRSSEEGGALTLQLRLRQQVEYGKMSVFKELAQDGLAEGMAVAIFTAFRLTLDALAEQFPDTSIIHGGVSSADRAEAIRRFQAGETNIILCTIGAGGSGISLHDRVGDRPRLALISPTFNAMEMHQVMGRVHRAGGKTKSIQRIIYAAGTVEEKVAKRLSKKLAGMKAFNDGDLTYQL